MAAIYMWFEEELVLTTTLYPINAIDEIDLSVSIESGFMGPIPSDDAQISEVEPLDGSYTQLRWFYEYGPEEDEAQLSEVEPLDGTYVQLRWFYTYGPEEDEVQISEVEPLDGTYVSARIWADSPDEEIDFTCTIESDCSMDSV